MSVVSCKPGIEPRNSHRTSVSVCRPQTGRFKLLPARDFGTGQSAVVYAALLAGLEPTESSQRTESNAQNARLKLATETGKRGCKG